jgi:hypothetical protein
MWKLINLGSISYSKINTEEGIKNGGRGRESEILSSMTPETSLRCWRYTWVILIVCSQNTSHHHIRY